MDVCKAFRIRTDGAVIKCERGTEVFVSFEHLSKLFNALDGVLNEKQGKETQIAHNNASKLPKMKYG
jgi:hypothetical protein